MFSKSGEYGIRSTLYIACNSLQGNRVSLKSISNAIDSPEAFTAKIMQQLTKHKIVSSIKGPNGGFFITEDQLEKITLLDVIEVIEGKDKYMGCGLGLATCNEDKPCPIHHQYAKVRNNLRAILEKSSLKSMALGLEKGQSFLKI